MGQVLEGGRLEHAHACSIHARPQVLRHARRRPVTSLRVRRAVDEALRALSRLEATGVSRSEAIRIALIQAAKQLQGREALMEEVAALEADEADRAEMLAVAEFMEQLRAAG